MIEINWFKFYLEDGSDTLGDKEERERQSDDQNILPNDYFLTFDLFA